MTRNIGASDLYLGGLTNLQYEFHPCHNHTHLLGYASYRLLAEGVEFAGGKASFCLQDGTRFDTNAWPRQRLRCSFQGISKGWGDYYWPGLPCQWIDVTDVPPGRYTLEIQIDLDNQLPESNENNNVDTLDLYIPLTPGTHVNEILETALTLTNLRFEIAGANIAATREPNEPAVGAGHSVWYRWVAPSNDVMSLDVVGSNFPARVGVFTGPASNLVHVANIDPFPIASPAKRVIFQANAGTEYSIAVDSEQANVTGQFKLNGWFGRPPKDDFGNQFTWDKVREGVRLSTVNATKQPGEPAHAGNAGGRSIWRLFQPPITRSVIITTGGSDFDTVLAVYSGNSLVGLEELARNDNVTPAQLWSQVTLDAEEDEEYWIAVDGRNGEGGRVELSIDEIDPQTEFLSISVHHGQVELELLGERGRSYRIEASTNLIHWTPLQTIYKDAATSLIYFPYNTEGARFFRALKLREND